jgi:hypothetical protein
MGILYGILHFSLAATSDHIIDLDVWHCLAFTIYYLHHPNLIFLWQFTLSTPRIEINKNLPTPPHSHPYHHNDILLLLDSSVYIYNTSSLDISSIRTFTSRSISNFWFMFFLSDLKKKSLMVSKKSTSC